ncbi:MAG TPA: lamin tail domain-containing protein, partial [Candidatus Acidoferrum sp.]|nr:lamin tail domain-containing protein [Candidatus Acidoferrum sp.]
MKIRLCFRAGLLCLGLLAVCVRSIAQPANGAYREVYTNLSGNTVANLTNTAVYPNFPGFDEVVASAFEAPVNWGELFGQRMRALVTAPATGNYIFWIASDDNGELWLSTDESSTNRQFIAAVKSNASSRQWTKETNQMSLPIPLIAGQRYYMEALMKEGTGGDNLAVRWQLPGGAWETSDTNAPIPAARLTPVGLLPPQIAQQPTNVTVVENGFATFSVRAARIAGLGYQWQRGGFNIFGATNNPYTLGPLGLGDSGSSFNCVITNWLGVTNTAIISLTVSPDSIAPTVSSVANLGDSTLLTIVFSEEVETATAINAANYAINLGVIVLDAQAGPDARTVLLTTSPLANNTTYTLTVNNVRDRATTPNPIAPNSQRTFTITPAPLPIAMVKPQPEPIGPSTRRGPLVISEIMYHPTNRADGKNIEFIEVYNTLPWFEEMGGYRISGAVNFTFPSNFILGARSFVVVAANPADVQGVYGTANVLGPWTGNLQNSSGTLRLHNKLGAILFDTEYTGDPPYPIAADDAGHSLVLARPSFGESDARAWAASDLAGGTPGTNEVAGGNPYAAVMINEIMAHTDLPDVDYIELFNYSATPLNIVSCSLSDDPSTNKFVFPAGSVIPPMSFIVVYETNLGFALGSAGEEIFMRNPQRTRVIDTVRFGAQENGVALGRYPDGAATFSRLRNKTPGTNNAPIRLPELVINEIMYHPASDNDDDEFIELYNPGTNTLDVSKWRLDDGVEFTIPPGTIIPPHDFFVIARNATRLRTQYPHLTAANCLGDWEGSLRNGGERIALTKPDEIVSTNGSGFVSTNTIHIAIDEVTYRDGGRWGRWSDGGGSSLELRDWRSDHRLAPNWADSEEAAKSQWINIETTTAATNGYPGGVSASAYQLHVTLMGAGECLIDNIEVIGAGGTNLVANWTFEDGTAGWIFQGNHNDSALVNEGYSSARSLRLCAAGRGDTGANRVRTTLPAVLVQGAPVTLRAKVRWLKGNPNVLLRLRGNWAELPGMTLNASRLGTPGAPNSVVVTNAGPAINDVTHWPVLPPVNQPVTVTARVHDADGLAVVLLKYRVDPGATYSSVTMVNNGAGLFSGVIPGQASNVTVAFFIQAADKLSSVLTTSFPSDAPQRECVVIWGDTTIPGTLPTYRIWLTQTNVARWSTEEKMSNKPKDVTFIYGTNRVVYNATAWFHGSPYHSPGYNSPVGVACDYDMGFPSDDRLLGDTDINLYRPGNGGSDSTGQAEIHAYWFGYQMGVGFLFHRPVFMYVNGLRRGTILHDSQQPNGEWAAQWWPDAPDGELHKIQIGFEFGDQAYGSSEPGFGTVGANFGRYFTTAGAFHMARYRQTLPLRSVSPTQQNDYTNLYSLVNSVNTTAAINTEAYTAVLTNATDVAWWYRVNVVQHLYENTDSFSYGGGQNAFLYKPARESWKLLLWDVDFAFGNGSGQGTNTALLNIGGADHGPRNDHSPFRRIYWQALLDSANTILLPERSNPILDARHSGLVAAGAAVASPNQMKNFIQNKRAIVLSQLATVPSPFSITSSNGQDFSLATNYFTLSGTAPIDVRTIEINGIAYSPTWSSITNWNLVVALMSGTNTLDVVGRDRSGNVVSNATTSIHINVTVPVIRPEDAIVINEIMYDPKIVGAEYIELFNRSTNASFDLAGWRVDGIDYTFAASAVILPRQYLVLAKDRIAYTNAYGAATLSFDVFTGNLQANGETITLIKPGTIASNDVVIDKVRFDNSAPWPGEAAGTGSSLQVVDPAQDNSRVGNWRSRFTAAVYSDAVSTPSCTNDGWRQVKVTTGFGSNNRLIIFLDNAGSVLLEDIALVAGTNA